MSVFSPSTACTITSPPRPPSPPFGPPNSMNFSRRNDTQPLPPSPERTYTLASSRNFMAPHMRCRTAKGEARATTPLARLGQFAHTQQDLTQDLEALAGKGQGGPCLTDAAQ